MYVLLDGFDLGVGILFPFARRRCDARTLMMDSVAPIWDGNETWLVLGGIGLFAAFPLAFAIIIPALYFPILLMLLGLIFRGVAFEFRLKAQRSRFVWDHVVLLGIAARDVRAGCRARSVRAGFEVRDGSSPARCSIGCAPFPAGGRRRPGVRLPAARRDLARDEDRGGSAALGAAQSPRSRLVRGDRLHRHGEHMDAASCTPHIAERWFSWPNFAVARARAARHRLRSRCGCGDRSRAAVTMRRRSSPRWDCS